MNKNLLLVVLSVFMFVGCADKQEVAEIIKIDLPQEEVPNINGTGMITDVELLSLDHPDVLMGEIKKILTHKNYIYLIAGQGEDLTVFVYDNKGTFLNKISRYGRGPQEYVQLMDIYVDKDERLCLVSRMDKKVLKFDVEGKNFISVEPLPVALAFVAYDKAEDLLYASVDNCSFDPDRQQNFWTLSPDYKVLSSSIDIDQRWNSRSFGGISQFSSYNGSWSYYKPLDYNIYEVSRDGARVKYTFDFGINGLTEEQLDPQVFDNMSFQESAKILSILKHVQETDRYIYFTAVYMLQYQLGAYDKQTKTFQMGTLNEYFGKYYVPFGTSILGMDQNALYTTISASSIKNMIDGKLEYLNENYPDLVKKLQEDFPGQINPYGAPFLAIFKLRQ